jgi:uncharacterized protein
LTLFVDSSAVVKLYVPERHHETVRARRDLMLLASLTRVEVASALWRKQRLGELDAADVVTLTAAFEADLGEPTGRFGVVSLAPPVLAGAVEMVARHGLRAYDAVQLATASVARDAIGELEAFAAFDHDLRRAARAESFTLVPADLS